MPAWSAKTVNEFYDAVRKWCLNRGLEFPKVIERGRRTIKLRVRVSRDAFIDLYFNESLQKLTSALIVKGERVFGINGEPGAWHRHLLRNTSVHEPIPSMSLDEVFGKYWAAVKEIGLV